MNRERVIGGVFLAQSSQTTKPIKLRSLQKGLKQIFAIGPSHLRLQSLLASWTAGTSPTCRY